MVTVSLTTGMKWDQQPLVQRLEGPYAAALERVYQFVEPLMCSRPIGLEDFTDHDLAHSTRIAQVIGQILPQHGAELHQPELYILLLAILLHDAGMWTPREEAEKLLTNPEFRSFCSRSHAAELAQVEELLRSSHRAWMGKLGLQQLAATYNRQKHPERLASFVLDTGSPTGSILHTLIGEDFVDAVVCVSMAHGWDQDTIQECDQLRPQQIGFEAQLCDLRFLAILLRLGDLLDFGDKRISRLVWTYLHPLNVGSEIHWRKEARIKIMRCDPNLIEMAGRYNIDTGGIPEREAYRLCTEWIRCIKSEIIFAHHYLHCVGKSFNNRFTLGAMQLDTSRVTVQGLAAEGDVTFELNRERIIRLLGDEIYSEGCIFIRELIQNAIDASRAQMVRDYKHEIDMNNIDFPPDSPWHWPISIIEKYPIEISTGVEDIDGSEYNTFLIKDLGIGMTLHHIQEYFLQVGISYYRTNEYKEEFCFSPIGHFGIGFLSCLLIADRIEVTTRPRHEASGLRLSMLSPSDHFIIERIETILNIPSGTCVKLWINNHKKPTGWNSMPLNSIHILNYLNIPEGNDGDFAIAARQWAMRSEIPIIINGECQQQRIMVSPQARREFQYHSSYINIIDNSKKVIADSHYISRVFQKSMIPIPEFESIYSGIDNTTQTITCIHGVFTECSQFAHNINILNYHKIPKNTLTAGRKIRHDILPNDDISNDILMLILKNTYKQLLTHSRECASLWRLLIPTNGGSDFPILLPCRSESGLEWITWNTAKKKYGKLLIVPFGVAWKNDWHSEFPCIGILNSDNNYRNGINTDNFSNCELISLPDTCTAYLWPPNTSIHAFSLLRGNATYLHNGIYMWPKYQLSKSLKNAIKINQKQVDISTLPNYDRNGNPWIKLGFSGYFRSDDNNTITDSIKDTFINITPFPDETVYEIVLDDTDGWE